MRVIGNQSVLLACSSCGTVLVNEGGFQFETSPLPADWSIVRIGTTGKYKEKRFEVIGCIRLQLRFEYKNFWCLWYESEKKYGWIIEALGSYFICEGTLFEMTEPEKNLKDIHARDPFILHGTTTVYTDYSDRSVWYSVAGEIAHWVSMPKSGLTVVQAQNEQGVAAYFLLDSVGKKTHFILGERVDVSQLNLSGIHDFADWK